MSVDTQQMQMQQTQLHSQAAQQHQQQQAHSTSGFYDPKTIMNYAALSAKCFPGFEPANSYSAAAYTQSLAAAGYNQATGFNGFSKPESMITSSTTSMFNNSCNSTPQVMGCHSTTPSYTPSKKKAQPVPVDQKDNCYWERRKRNNESARRSRESRRQKEEQISFRVVYLEQENMQLRTEVGMLRSEIEKLRSLMMYSTAATAHHASINNTITA